MLGVVLAAPFIAASPGYGALRCDLLTKEQACTDVVYDQLRFRIAYPRVVECVFRCLPGDVGDDPVGSVREWRQCWKPALRADLQGLGDKSCKKYLRRLLKNTTCGRLDTHGLCRKTTRRGDTVCRVQKVERCDDLFYPVGTVQFCSDGCHNED
jgi:hypothetical protein